MRENTCMTSKEFERCALSFLLVLSTTEIDSYQSVTAIRLIFFVWPSLSVIIREVKSFLHKTFL